MKIIVVFIGFGYRAYFENEPRVAGYGATKSEAVGDLLYKYGKVLQITIVDG